MKYIRSLLALLMVSLASCAPVNSGTTPTVMPIGGPSGYDCFAIMDGDRVAGGNCVKN
jgi:hypothetical protein